MLLGSPPDMVHSAPSHRTRLPVCPKGYGYFGYLIYYTILTSRNQLVFCGFLEFFRRDSGRGDRAFCGKAAKSRRTSPQADIHAPTNPSPPLCSPPFAFYLKNAGHSKMTGWFFIRFPIQNPDCPATEKRGTLPPGRGFPAPHPTTGCFRPLPPAAPGWRDGGDTPPPAPPTAPAG